MHTDVLSNNLGKLSVAVFLVENSVLDHIFPPMFQTVHFPLVWMVLLCQL